MKMENSLKELFEAIEYLQVTEPMRPRAEGMHAHQIHMMLNMIDEAARRSMMKFIEEVWKQLRKIRMHAAHVLFTRG